ncbi:MAG: zinc ribbon domain-containing protein [Gemmatimonadetes bacterium]|nr:zinc ribbon domain-containing protein [Gemmatimonadota bacterium]
MPTYEYRCPEGHVFEQFQRITDPPVAICPQCGGEAERQLSAGSGFLFKGSGFYSTDYRPESYKKAAAAESGDSKPGGPASTSGDSPKSKGTAADS